MKWVWACVFLAGALLAWTWTFNEDLGFQLNAARFFWEHGDVPRGEPFLDIYSSHHYVDLQWLWQLALYAIYTITGLEGAMLANLLIQALAGGILLWRYRSNEGVSAGPVTALLLLMFFIGSPGTIRPHSLSWVFLGLVLHCLESARRGDMRGAQLLPLCMAGWVNCHALYSLGLITIFLYLGASLGADSLRYGVGVAWKRGKTLWAGGIVAVLACLLNPYGWEALFFPLQQAQLIFSNSMVKEVVDELQPLWAGSFWDTPWGGFPVVHVKKITMNILFIALVLGGWWGRSKIPLSAWVIGTAFAVLPLAASKNFGYFFFAFAPYAAIGWEALARKFCKGDVLLRRGVLTAALVIIVLVVSGRWDSFFWSPRFGVGLDSGIHPTGAGDLLGSLPADVRILNGHNQGGWLGWRSKKRVFIDSRNDIYPHELFEDVRRAEIDPIHFLNLLERTGAGAVFASVKDQPLWIRILSARAGPDGWRNVGKARWQGPDWRPVWMDAKGVLFLRAGVATTLPEVKAMEPEARRWKEVGLRVRDILKEQSEKPFSYARLFLMGARTFPTDLNRLLARSSAMGQGSELKGFALSAMEKCEWFYPMIWMNLALWLEQDGDHELADECWAVLDRRLGDSRIRLRAEEIRGWRGR